ncbi:hypothetical protein [Streptomyces bullii]|uniref:Uncharacterized protein n=1 Tax=Streptomyces bullii TaxID=349910 RepID=A0ABW0V6H3_9ACTN
MAHPMTPLAQRHDAGQAWLADCSPRPDLVRAQWEREELAAIPSGGHWLVAETTVAHGLPALARIREDQRGPVLGDAIQDRAWWLMPLDAAEELADVRQVQVRPAGWSLACPPLGAYRESRFWLWHPDGSGHLTDPAVLAAAFGPGGYVRPTEARP